MKVLFITFSSAGQLNFHDNNSRLRKNVLTSLACRVTEYKCEAGRFLRDFSKLIGLAKKTDIIYLRIDGTSALDKFTLLKLFTPKIPVVWEVHGVAEENLIQQGGYKVKAETFKNNLKRGFLSKFVDAHVFISDELCSYFSGRFNVKKAFVVPNFVNVEAFKSDLKQGGITPIANLLNDKKFFKIFWGGNSFLRWQALDVIERLAKEIYRLDKNIIFLICGHESWHTFLWKRNILFLGELSRGEYLKVASLSDICLALYKNPKVIPFYFFPLKVLDFMFLGRVVIASGFGSIKRLIENGVTGYLSDNSINYICEKIIFLKKNRNVLKRIGMNAKRKVMSNNSSKKAKMVYGELLSYLSKTP